MKAMGLEISLHTRTSKLRHLRLITNNIIDIILNNNIMLYVLPVSRFK